MIGRGAHRQRVGNGARQLLQIERLGKVFERPLLGRPDRRGKRVLRGKHDHRHARQLGDDLGHHVEAVAVGQHDIGDQHIGHEAAEQLAQLRDARRRFDDMARAAQRLADHQPDRGVVVDDEDAARRHARGSRIRNTVRSGVPSRAYSTTPP